MEVFRRHSVQEFNSNAFILGYHDEPHPPRDELQFYKRLGTMWPQFCMFGITNHHVVRNIHNMNCNELDHVVSY